MASECGTGARHQQAAAVVGRTERDGVLAAPRVALARNEPRSKRGFDLVLSLVLLAVLAPVFALIAVAIKLDSRGPVLYRGRRVGRRGSSFSMLKFRKMHEGASGSALTSLQDNRFTRVGAVLARTKLDELPQLWNVALGEMSLVGPRPEDPGFVESQPAAFDEVLTVRPGITGLTQLAFAQEARVLDRDDSLEYYVEHLLPQKLAIDRLYVRRRTLLLDLRILTWTIAAVLLRIDVAVNRRDATLGRRAPRGRVAV